MTASTRAGQSCQVARSPAADASAAPVAGAWQRQQGDGDKSTPGCELCVVARWEWWASARSFGSKPAMACLCQNTTFRGPHQGSMSASGRQHEQLLAAKLAKLPTDRCSSVLSCFRQCMQYMHEPCISQLWPRGSSLPGRVATSCMLCMPSPWGCKHHHACRGRVVHVEVLSCCWCWRRIDGRRPASTAGRRTHANSRLQAVCAGAVGAVGVVASGKVLQPLKQAACLMG